MAMISPSEAQRIAELAHLHIDDTRLDTIAAGLDSIVDFGTKLQGIDTSAVEPTSQVTGLIDVLRDDVVRPSTVIADELLAAAPDSVDRYFKVKRVMK